MKIINTLKKFFNRNIVENNFSTTSTDNILMKNQNMMLDDYLKNNDIDIYTIKNFLTTRFSSIENTEDFGNENLFLFTIGNLCVITGHTYAKTSVTASKQITLPFRVSPFNGVYNWSPFVKDGTTYKLHYEIQRLTPDKLDLFFYDEFPGGTIPINLVFVLDTLNPNLN